MTGMQLPAAVPDLSWRDDAACLGTDVEAFFPQGNAFTLAARVIGDWCVPCPVRQACLDDEVARSSTHRNGIRGGVLWQSGGKRFDPHHFLPTEEA